jgi:hypothetical protein
MAGRVKARAGQPICGRVLDALNARGGTGDIQLEREAFHP